MFFDEWTLFYMIVLHMCHLFNAWAGESYITVRVEMI